MARALGEVFAADSELIEYVQRLFGYGLTGDVREQILPIFWGRGTAPSTLNIILSMLGEDYVSVATVHVAMIRQPPDAVGPPQEAIIVCTESQEGGRLDEGLVKELTGGDRIRARRMREDAWQFW